MWCSDTPGDVHGITDGLTSVAPVGSGLILLVIVGAWLAVLVPMGLRSHDSSSAYRSTERFGDAMRVLSRRRVGAEPEPAGTRRGGRAAGSVRLGSARHAVLHAARAGSRRLAVARSGSVRVTPARARRAPVSAAVRRRRVLAGLGTLLVLLLVAGIAGPRLLLVAAAVAAVLLALFLVACRRATVQRLAQRRAEDQRAYEQRAHEQRAHGQQAYEHRASRDDEVTRLIAALPNRLPARLGDGHPIEAGADRGGPDAASSAVRYDERPARVSVGSRAVAGPGAAASGGDTWQPVPVPLPTYLDGRAGGPHRRVVDLTEPGAWTAAQQAGAPRAEDVGDGHEDAAPRRQAAGAW